MSEVVETGLRLLLRPRRKQGTLLPLSSFQSGGALYRAMAERWCRRSAQMSLSTPPIQIAIPRALPIAGAAGRQTRPLVHDVACS